MSGMWQMRLRLIIKTLGGPSWRFIMQLLLDGLIGPSRMTGSTGILNGTSRTIIFNLVGDNQESLFQLWLTNKHTRVISVARYCSPSCILLFLSYINHVMSKWCRWFTQQGYFQLLLVGCISMWLVPAPLVFALKKRTIGLQLPSSGSHITIHLFSLFQEEHLSFCLFCLL